MNNKKKNQSPKTADATPRDLEFEADVLFQRLYDKWYAFTLVDDECLMSEVDAKSMQRRIRRSARAA